MHNSLDKFDLSILQALENNGAQTNAALAELVGLSTSQCSRRRATLENSGVIVGYQARLNPEIMGRSLRAVVRINLNSPFANFIHEKLLPFPNVGQVKSEIVLRGLK